MTKQSLIIMQKNKVEKEKEQLKQAMRSSIELLESGVKYEDTSRLILEARFVILRLTTYMEQTKEEYDKLKYLEMICRTVQGD